MIRSSVDLPQPEGPISETNSPGSIARSMSCSATTSPRSKRFVSLLDLDDLRHATCSGARRDDELLGEHDDEEERDAEQRGDEFVAQRFCGLSV